MLGMVTFISTLIAITIVLFGSVDATALPARFTVGDTQLVWRKHPKSHSSSRSARWTAGP